MKAELRLTLSSLLMVLLLPVSAQAQFTFSTNSDGSLTISSYTSTSSVVVIPATTNGLPITSIGSGAFEQDANLKSVTIGTNVASIGDGAFTDCSSLTNILIPNSVTSIGDYAFFITAPYGGLLGVTIGTGVTNIGSYAFYNNSLGNVYFLGNAPNVDATSFDYVTANAFYYLPWTTGWTLFDQLYGDFLPIGAWLSDVQITASPTNSCAGLSVQFNCPNMDSQGNIITNWNWTFGDGTTSTNQNPTHIYANSGIFQPFLLAINNSGTDFPGYGPSVTVYPPPVIGGISISANSLVLNGNNGVSGLNYYLLSTTNLSLPKGQWTPIETNTWSGNGHFTLTVTNFVNPSVHQQFYTIEVP